MEEYESTKSINLENLKAAIDGIKSIYSITNYEKVIQLDTEDELRKIKDSAIRLKNKLETGEFEIAIIGLEKAGKSSFANALMGNNLLPTKDERCTYTSTVIQYGDIDHAVVEFFDKEEFEKSFDEKLHKLGIENSESFSEWTLDKFNNCLDDNMLSSDLIGLKNDVGLMIEKKNSILHFIGSGKEEFISNHFDIDVKPFIEVPEKAMAVKKINIHSKVFSNMQNAIIYDVPGFNSPTQMHKEQTLEMMKRADAIILLVNASQPSFTDSFVNFFKNVDYDNDGLNISEKIFIFGNRADCATTLEDNKKKIIDELLRYKIIGKEKVNDRLVLGSAKAYLDKLTGESDSAAITGLQKLGIDDGIDIMRKKLETYNKSERLSVLTTKIEKLLRNIRNILGQTILDNCADIDADKEWKSETNALKNDSRSHIIEELGKCRNDLETAFSKSKPITLKICEKIISKISTEKYMITDEEIIRSKNQSRSGIVSIEKTEADIRDKKFTQIYDEFIDEVIDLAVDEHSDGSLKIKNAFIRGLGVNEKDSNYKQLSEKVNSFIEKNKKITAPEGYYSSLIRRYSRALFEILIGTSYSTPERYSKFISQKNNYYSLALFDAGYDASVMPGKQPMHYQMLFHKYINGNDENQTLENCVILIENITGEILMEKDKIYRKLKEFIDVHGSSSETLLKEKFKSFNVSEREKLDFSLFPQNNAMKESIISCLNENTDEDTENASIEISENEYRNFFLGYRRNEDSIKEAFANDVTVLHSILKNQVMKAIDIETPFIDLIKQEISDIRNSVDSNEFFNFIDDYADLILGDRVSEIIKRQEEQKTRKMVSEEITKMLNTLPC